MHRCPFSATQPSRDLATRSHSQSDSWATAIIQVSALLNQRPEASQPQAITNALPRRRKVLLMPLKTSKWMTMPFLLSLLFATTSMFVPTHRRRYNTNVESLSAIQDHVTRIHGDPQAHLCCTSSDRLQSAFSVLNRRQGRRQGRRLRYAITL